MSDELEQYIIRAKELLPRMDDEVFDLYIVPLIKLYGWPFWSLDQPLSQVPQRWVNAFDHQGIKTISQLSWERHEMPFARAPFHPQAHQVVSMLIEHHAGIRLHAGIANVADTRNKFLRARDYIARTGQMPKPVILMRDRFGGALRILDGNHRLAAMATVPNANDFIIDCWIGTLKP